MKCITPLLLFFFAFLIKDVQGQSSKYIIVLKDKQHNPFSLNHPGQYLSAKSVERRRRQQIAIDSTDLPVTPAYLDSIKNAGEVAIINTSKWLNQALIQTDDASALEKINQFSFVRSSAKVSPRISSRREHETRKYELPVMPLKRIQKVQDENDALDYGNMSAQVKIHEGDFLHNMGFRGEGMTIAMLDAGYYHYDTNPAFDSIRLNNQILGTWDFVDNKADVSEEHYHGMVCLSTIAANRPGLLVGTAPKANFYLFRTEDVGVEYPTEEQNWVVAAEKADSLGVDLITSSLGYNTFSNPVYDYTYEEMDGQTAIITRGAEMAAQKGIFVTNSAGNSGQDSWHYIIAPADGEHVLAIGAVNYSKDAAPFSSYGPAADGRTKPNVASVGWGTVIADTYGNPSTTNGTSLANPNLAGLIACLWQAFPEFTNAAIFDAVQRSADKFNTPDDRVGFGIPNMRIAYEILDRLRQRKDVERILNNDWLKVYPVPFYQSFNIVLNPSQPSKATLSLYNVLGQKVYNRSIMIESATPVRISVSDLAYLSPGIYWLSYPDGKQSRVVRLVKQ
ncbi:MAG: S8 family serine peptidase [Chitinophagaceae bacterium]|nr:S8 family serine peptidase [Chitinophagaceae bacterium]